MVVAWLPIAIAAPFFDSQPLVTELSSVGVRGWVAIFYNIFLAGTIAHWAWFYLARTLPVAVSSLSSLPVPVVGVFAGIVVLGEKPGPQEWIALTLVVIALFIVLSEPRETQPAAVPLAPDDVTVNVVGVCPMLPSVTVTSLMESEGARSSSLMVPVPVPVPTPMIALLGLVRLTVTFDPTAALIVVNPVPAPELVIVPALLTGLV